METKKSELINSFFIFKLRITSELIVEIISGLFFLLFLYAATNKLFDYQGFKVQLAQSPILTPVSNQVAWFIPALEVAISFFLVIPKTRLFALYASYSLMVMFTAYIVVILNFTQRVPCACGGILESMQWREHFVFNVFFILIAIVAIILQSNLIKKSEH